MGTLPDNHAITGGQNGTQSLLVLLGLSSRLSFVSWQVLLQARKYNKMSNEDELVHYIIFLFLPLVFIMANGFVYKPSISVMLF